MAKVPVLDWERSTLGHPAEAWRAAKAEVRGLLVDTARRRSVITYTEIADAVTSVKVPRQGSALGQATGQLLGQVVMEESRRLGRIFMISAVAVSVEMKPSSGFRGLAEDLGVSGEWEHWLPLVWRQYSQ